MARFQPALPSSDEHATLTDTFFDVKHIASRAHAARDDHQPRCFDCRAAAQRRMRTANTVRSTGRLPWLAKTNSDFECVDTFNSNHEPRLGSRRPRRRLTPTQRSERESPRAAAELPRTARSAALDLRHMASGRVDDERPHAKTKMERGTRAPWRKHKVPHMTRGQSVRSAPHGSTVSSQALSSVSAQLSLCSHCGAQPTECTCIADGYVGTERFCQANGQSPSSSISSNPPLQNGHAAKQYERQIDNRFDTSDSVFADRTRVSRQTSEIVPRLSTWARPSATRLHSDTYLISSEESARAARLQDSWAWLYQELEEIEAEESVAVNNASFEESDEPPELVAAELTPSAFACPEWTRACSSLYEPPEESPYDATYESAGAIWPQIANRSENHHGGMSALDRAAELHAQNRLMRPRLYHPDVSYGEQVECKNLDVAESTNTCAWDDDTASVGSDSSPSARFRDTYPIRRAASALPVHRQTLDEFDASRRLDVLDSEHSARGVDAGASCAGGSDRVRKTRQLGRMLSFRADAKHPARGYGEGPRSIRTAKKRGRTRWRGMLAARGS